MDALCPSQTYHDIRLCGCMYMAWPCSSLVHTVPATMSSCVQLCNRVQKIWFWDRYLLSLALNKLLTSSSAMTPESEGKQCDKDVLFRAKHFTVSCSLRADWLLFSVLIVICCSIRANTRYRWIYRTESTQMMPPVWMMDPRKGSILENEQWEVRLETGDAKTFNLYFL